MLKTLVLRATSAAAAVDSVRAPVFLSGGPSFIIAWSEAADVAYVFLRTRIDKPKMVVANLNWVCGQTQYEVAYLLAGLEVKCSSFQQRRQDQTKCDNFLHANHHQNEIDPVDRP
ncbi:hypothetical protein ON010_g4212 [Phytophthora cinnamomi]|nr:hypothetical protein ON010_g4212 [Phytophthora cinnamomi]